MEYLEKILTKKQYDIYKMLLEGYKCVEISEKMGCSKQNVYHSISISKGKIEIYNNLLSGGMSEEEAEREVKKVKKKQRNSNVSGGRKSTILVDHMGERKALSELCKEFGVEYSTAYARYKRGLPIEKVLEKRERIDYTIKEEYDLSLISDDYRYILEQKNAGRSFEEIAKDIGQTSVNVQIKAKAAINKLQGKEADKTVYMRKRHNELKNNEEYIEKKREYARKWYSEHLEQERERGKRRNEKRREERIKNGEAVKERTDYTIKDEYDLSLISDECKEILTRKNNGDTFVSIAHDLGCSPTKIRAKAKSAIDLLQSKKLSKKICQNCGKSFYANSNRAKYCDDCKNGKIYVKGHEKERHGELIVDRVYLHKGRLYAECTCSCGRKSEPTYISIKSGKTKMCAHHSVINLEGQVNEYGIKALYKTGEMKKECYVWRCLCTCGKEFDVLSTDFQIRKSCGHAQDDARKSNIKIAQKEYNKYSSDGTNAIVLMSKIGKNNKSGRKGVHWNKNAKKWEAGIVFKGKNYYLGVYDDINNAINARKIAEEHMHKDFLNWFSEEFPLLYKKISTKSELNEENAGLERIKEIRSRNRDTKK